jgi:hypothetical protein
VEGTGDQLVRLTQSTQTFLVLVDVDFRDASSDQVLLSGSVVLQEILENLPSKDEARL